MSQTDSRHLTPREAEILELIAHGLTNSQVAARLDVTVHAVKFHLASIYRKLNVANRTEAASLFHQRLAGIAAETVREQNGDRPAEVRKRRDLLLANPPVLELPLSHEAASAPGTGTERGREEMALGRELTDLLRAQAAARFVDVPSFLLAALAALLHRYTGLEELVVCGEGRPLWLDVTGDPSFAELVDRVDRELATKAPVAADVSRTGRDERLQVAFAAGTLDPPCELEFALEARLEGIVAVASFDSAEFAPTMAAQLLRHLVVLLTGGVDDPSCPVSMLPVLTPTERARMLDEWNDTTRPYPLCRADELFAEQARLRPDEVAVTSDDGRLTYGELDVRVNGLAHHLQSLGVGPEVLVAICVERSIDMVVGLLGIMRAGGAYVPVDPGFPRERQQFMLEDAAVQVVVTQERLLPQLNVDGAAVVCLDRDATTIIGTNASPPPCGSTPDNLAYVIYTSGSTGRPKGVQISHRALVNFLTTMRDRPGLNEDDTLVAVTTLSFDIAGLELYLPLAAGGRVVIASQAVAADPRRLGALMEESGATVVQATPTTWRMLIESGWSGRPGLKVLCGGEALPTILAEQLLERGLELWNMYGPTETTIWSAIRPLSAGQPLTIGRPIANTALYILDDALQPMPVGVAGELHIGGDGVARGYLNRPELTAEKFIPHPFDPAPGARVYKTGDLARYRDDGEIVFLGRRDHQVKLRGFRIELGEIETALMRQPEITTAVAVTREDAPGDVRLVAYVVSTGGTPETAGELRRALTEVLPSYMVPSAIVLLDELPLTPNGKIDRKALPEPQQQRPGAASSLVQPRTKLEEQLVDVWEAELGISPIGVTDDFFMLGVTSIVAARLLARIERQLGGSLPLGALFRAPTIESLARLLEHGTEESRWTSLVPIQPYGSKPPLFCVHGGAGTILHLQPLARRLGSDQPFYGLQARGLYGGVAPLRTVEQMAIHYLDELRTVQPHGPYKLAGYCFGSIVAFDMAQRLVQAGETVELLAAFNGPSPTWLHKYRSISRQPSRLARRPPSPPSRSMRSRIAGVLVNPHKQLRWARYLAWRLRHQTLDRLRTRLSLPARPPDPRESPGRLLPCDRRAGGACVRADDVRWVDGRLLRRWALRRSRSRLAGPREVDSDDRCAGRAQEQPDADGGAVDRGRLGSPPGAPCEDGRFA